MSTPELSTDALLADARNKAGLENFGDPRFRDGLDMLVRSVNDYTADENIRAGIRNTLLGRLITRLQIQDAFDKHPEILEQEIRQPMFVTGLPRSGTSALFNLLNSDPDTRGLLLWEIHCPQPFEGLPPMEQDPRYKAVHDAIEANRDPEIDKIHYVAADNPEECCMLQVYSFDGVASGWEYLLEPYHSWFREHALDFLYEEHRNHLKLLQWQRPGTRWLLKAPAHMWALDEIVKLFPDVCLVWGHREPVGVTASICSMTEKMVWNATFGGVEEKELQEVLGPRIMDWYATSLERGLAARKNIDPDRVLDYSFTEFIDDPRAVVERIYHHFDLPLPDTTRRAIEAHIAAHTKGKHGDHTYDLAHYGLTEQQVQDRYRFYLDGEWL